MKIRIFQTAKDSEVRFNAIERLADRSSAMAKIVLNESDTFQTHMGFGGAFTEAAAYTLSRVSKTTRDEVLKSYFDRDNGLGYTIGRVHMNSCDFALENYTYVTEGDQTLESFDISREDKWVVPMVKDASLIAMQPIKLMISPWSPPAYMKTNGTMNHGGKLLPQYQRLWAEYYVRFIQALEERNLNVWGLTVQNEPAAVQVWDSCIYTAEEERDFIKHYLGPVLKENQMGDKALVIWDHNRDILVERACTVLDDPDARQYVWGTGNHWYVSEAFENLSILHQKHPDKHILFTEGTQEGGTHVGSWDTGERYGRNIIGDFNNWSEGWLDWNLVLDEMGGPNHVGNYCDAPILVDTVNDQLIYNSSYYYIGHFSKFIQPGAQRIGALSNLQGKIWHTAFKNADGTVVLVVQNEESSEFVFDAELNDEKLSIKALPHSITTVVFS